MASSPVMAWWHDAACRDMDTSLFYDFEHTPSRRVPAEVRQACERCPVKTECLMEALQLDFHGFRAGTTAGDRRRMRSRVEWSSFRGIDV